jgi:hypothetical protein
VNITYIISLVRWKHTHTQQYESTNPSQTFRNGCFDESLFHTICPRTNDVTLSCQKPVSIINSRFSLGQSHISFPTAFLTSTRTCCMREPSTDPRCVRDTEKQIHVASRFYSNQ